MTPFRTASDLAAAYRMAWEAGGSLGQSMIQEVAFRALLTILKKIELAEKREIAAEEVRALGHRIMYDTKTGHSVNIAGCHVSPDELDESGYRVRFCE